MGGVPPPSGPTVQFGESVRLGGACPLWDRPTSDVGTLPVSTRNWPATFADASRSVVKSRGVESEKTFRFGTCGPVFHSEPLLCGGEAPPFRSSSLPAPTWLRVGPSPKGTPRKCQSRPSCCAVMPFRVRDGFSGSLFWGPHNSQQRGHLLW